jgi:hypothetical protein
MVVEVNPAEAREIDSSRYPPHLPEAGFIQPCPRRIRATRADINLAASEEDEAP